MSQEINPYALSVLSTKQTPDKTIDVDAQIKTIKEFTSKFFIDGIEGIFITNTAFTNGTAFFNLLIHREYMHLSEKKLKKVNHTKFFFKTGAIEFNKQDMPREYIKELGRKIKYVVNQIASKKADVLIKRDKETKKSDKNKSSPK